jgi:predicted dehydrogenase
MLTDLRREPLRVGLIGAGMIGRFRARALAQTPELRLVAVADVRPDCARELARLGDGITVFSDGEELARHPHVQAVILSTPPVSHEPLGLACLAAGKHLLCEKPLAPTPAACDALVRAADRAGVSLATGFNLRFSRAARLARRLLDDGAIGELDHVRAFHGYPGGPESPHPWIANPAMSGGGALMDNGIHLIDLTRWVLGDVQSVTGYATSHVWPHLGCEDNGFLLLANARGRVATLQASWTEWRGYYYRLEVYGTEGFIRFGYPPLYLVHGRRRPGGKAKVRRYLFPVYQVVERIRGWQWGLVETLVEELTAWARALAAGSPPPVTGQDGLEAVRIAQAAQRCRHGELAVPSCGSPVAVTCKV